MKYGQVRAYVHAQQQKRTLNSPRQYRKRIQEVQRAIQDPDVPLSDSDPQERQEEPEEIHEMSPHPTDSPSPRNLNTARPFVVDNRLRRPDREYSSVSEQTDHFEILGHCRH